MKNLKKCIIINFTN